MEGQMAKGMVVLSNIPVFSKASFSSKLLDQFVYGEMYEVYWMHDTLPFYFVGNIHNKAMGWIIEGHYNPVTEEFFNEKRAIDRRIVSSLFGVLTLKQRRIQLGMGAVLPITAMEIFPFDGDIDYSGESVNIGSRRSIDYLLSCAKKFINIPFLKGGRTPFGIDSAGLVCTLYRLLGYELPRQLNEMETYGQYISSIENANQGDLVFFADNLLNTYHVGMLIERDKILHVDTFVTIDEISEEGIYNANKDDIIHKIVTIKRIVKY